MDPVRGVVSSVDGMPEGAGQVVRVEDNGVQGGRRLTGVDAQGVSDMIRIGSGHLGSFMDVPVKGHTRLVPLDEIPNGPAPYDFPAPGDVQSGSEGGEWNTYRVLDRESGLGRVSSSSSMEG